MLDAIRSYNITLVHTVYTSHRRACQLDHHTLFHTVQFTNDIQNIKNVNISLKNEVWNTIAGMAIVATPRNLYMIQTLSRTRHFFGKWSFLNPCKICNVRPHYDILGAAEEFTYIVNCYHDMMSHQTSEIPSKIDNTYHFHLELVLKRDVSYSEDTVWTL